MSNTQITGANLVAFLESAGEVSPVFRKKAEETFKKYGITDPDEGDWYDNDDFTEAMHDVVDKAGPKTVQQAGREMVRFNDEILQQDEIGEGLAIFAEQHKATHKNFSVETAGLVECTRTSETTYRIAGTGGYKYPESLLRGAAKESLLQTGNMSQVRIEDAEPEGDEVIAFELTW